MVVHAYHHNLEPQVGYAQQVKVKMLWVKGKNTKQLPDTCVHIYIYTCIHPYTHAYAQNSP